MAMAISTLSPSSVAIRNTGSVLPGTK